MGDTSRSAVRSNRLFGYAWTLVWLVAPLAVTTQIVLDARLGGDTETPFWGVLSYNLPRWVVWTPLSVWVQWLAGRTRSWRVHGVSVLLCVVIASAAWTLQAQRLRNYSQAPPARLFLVFVPVTVLWTFVVYAAITAWVWGREARRQLAEVRLESLQRQLQPHFFFNTLHTIASLVRVGRGDDAVAMTARLGDLLRETLNDARDPETLLERELALLEQYLDIQRVRFGERLSVTADVPAEVRRARVPGLLLQPLVENSLEHGVATQPGGGWVEVAARREGRDLVLTVRNSGSAAAPTKEADGGVGLRNSRERLRTLHGDRGTLRLEQAGEGVVTVTARMPYREAAER